MSRAQSSALKYSEVHQVIRASLTALSVHGLEACLFGSAAMLTYGMKHRLPNDIDLVILNTTQEQTDEDVKDLIVSSDPTSFFLTDSKKEEATHRILWYALSETPEITSTRPSSKKPSSRSKKYTSAELEDPPSSQPLKSDRACKVDILLPGALDIPFIPKNQLFLDPSAYFMSFSSSTASSDPSTTTTSKSNPAPSPIPSIPFLALLSLKLRAWVDHSFLSAPEKLHARIPDDEEDIEELLRISGTLTSSQGIMSLDASTRADAEWMHAGFRTRKEARKAVAQYMKKWPGTKSAWGAIGFGF